QLSFLSSSSGFSQSLEYEADEGGFEFAQKKGYDSTEAINLFEQMATFTKDEEIKEPFFFSSHPKLLERIKKFQELNASKPSTSKTLKIEPENYLNLTRQLRLDNIDMCFERGYYKTAERNIDFYISLYPDDVQGMLRKAELFRRRQDPPPKKKKRQKDEDYIKALDVYEKILFLHPDLPSAWLGKARILQKLSRTEDAKKSFQKYLELEPGSAERLYIEQFLNTLATERAS
ncbi:MAG: tetratricopeptide repeat protein, partial [Candidatus Omnitrophica bacterium]|nr:tetratricopeptide repeat protein [Candidatus Omnitrophota bacterium]